MPAGTFLPPGLTTSDVKITSGGTDNYVMTAVDGETIQGEANLTFSGSALTVIGTLTVGANTAGHDVKFFGDTASAYILWDTSADKLLTAGGAVIDIVKDKLLIGGTAVTTTAAELNVLDAVTAGTVSGSLGVVVDSNKDIASFRHVTLTGNLIVASGQGIDFSATGQAAGMASELFDDYEEGTFTPTIQDDSLSNGESQGYSVNVGFYTKIGNQVFFRLRITVTSLGSLTTSEQTRIAGLPFTSSSTANSFGLAYLGFADGLAITAAASVVGRVEVNASHIRMVVWDVTTGATQLTLAELSADADIMVSGFYGV